MNYATNLIQRDNAWQRCPRMNAEGKRHTADAAKVQSLDFF